MVHNGRELKSGGVGNTLMVKRHVTGDIVSFADGADAPVHDMVVNIEAVQEGSGDPSPDNIRPISGWTGVEVYDDPKYGGTIKWNQLLGEKHVFDTYSKFGITFSKISGKMGIKVTGTFNYESGDRNAYIFRQNYPIRIIKDHVYCIAYISKYANVYCYGATFTGNWIGNAPHGGSIIKANNSADLNLSLNFGSNISKGTVFNEEIFINLFDLTEMLGEEKANEIYDIDMTSPRGQGVAWFKSLFPNDYYDTDDSYTETLVSAVNGNPYRHVTIPIGQTVYGGTLDVTTGVLTVTDAQIASYNGEALPSTWISDRDIYAEGTTPTTGAQVVYKLGTPLTYRLTPTEVMTLLGQNNIFADTGSVDVTYIADSTITMNNIKNAITSLGGNV